MRARTIYATGYISENRTARASQAKLNDSIARGLVLGLQFDFDNDGFTDAMLRMGISPNRHEP
jgi:hypothetical protein